MSYSSNRESCTERERDNVREREMEAISTPATECCNSASPACPAMKIPCLQGGSGEDSYVNNSKVQNYMFHRYAKGHLSQALDHISSTFYSSVNLEEMQHRNLCVADLGCCHGPNTLEYAHFIVQGMQKRLQGMLLHMKTGTHASSPDGRCKMSVHTPSPEQHFASIPGHFEMQYLFSDLPGNDFNALFQSLLPLGPQLQNAQLVVADAENMNSGGFCAHPLPMNVFAAGVPGSFHGRLFPKDSLHLVVCAFSLHWLSQVPPSVLDRTSPAWNDGHVWLHGGRPKVVEAYAQQFQEDAKAFLHSRAKELVRGGILFIFALSRSQEHPHQFFLEVEDGNDLWMGDFQSTWLEMVHEGLITQEEMDTFNVPVYYFHQSELEVALESVGDLEVIKVEVLKDCCYYPKSISAAFRSNPEAFGKTRATFIASLIKPLVQAHLGENGSEELFKRLHPMVAKRVANYNAKSIITPISDIIIATIRRR